jgi:ABC-type polar amino acid transport system ATPase subunit
MGFARKAADYIVFIDKGKAGEKGPSETFFDTNGKPRLAEFMSHVFE